MEEDKSRAMTFEVDEASDTIALYGGGGRFLARYSEDDLIEASFADGIESYAKHLQSLGYRQAPLRRTEEQRSLARLERLRTLEVADRNCAMRPSDEIPPAPLPVEKVGRFDAFKGWAPGISGSVSQPQPMGLPSSDLQRASHQVHYEHGSAVFALEKKG